MTTYICIQCICACEIYCKLATTTITTITVTITTITITTIFFCPRSFAIMVSGQRERYRCRKRTEAVHNRALVPLDVPSPLRPDLTGRG